MKSKNIIATLLLTLGMTLGACSNDEPVFTPEDTNRPAETDGGYLFVFMTNTDYGKLFYALSRDCFEWETLNKGKIVNHDYIGHPDIIQGPDGTFHMMVVDGVNLYHWTSTDLIDWDKQQIDEQAIKSAASEGFYVGYYYGAPKLYYDKDSDQYLMSWHACKVAGGNDDWDSMTTLYTLTKDFKTFTHPQLLFNFTGEFEGMPTIDTIIRKVGNTYYAITKDERDHDLSPVTGKCIVICKSDKFTGPYGNPVKQVTPNDIYREAPIWVERPGNAGLAIYAESYNESPFGYNMFINTTGNPEDDWHERTFNGPCASDGTNRSGARHGCIVKVNEQVYQKLRATYGHSGKTEVKP